MNRAKENFGKKIISKLVLGAYLNNPRMFENWADFFGPLFTSDFCCNTRLLAPPPASVGECQTQLHNC